MLISLSMAPYLGLNDLTFGVPIANQRDCVKHLLPYITPQNVLESGLALSADHQIDLRILRRVSSTVNETCGPPAISVVSGKSSFTRAEFSHICS